MPRDHFKAIPAAYVVLMQDEKVLLLRRQNTGYADGMLALPAGHLDGDELASQAGAREAYEEVGVTVDPLSLRCVHVSHRLNRQFPGQERMDFFFMCDQWQGTPVNNEPDKSSEIVWASMDALPSDVTPFITAVLKDIRESRFYSEYVVDPA